MSFWLNGNLHGHLLTLAFLLSQNTTLKREIGLSLTMVPAWWLSLYHVAVIGNTGVGKSALCNFLSGE